jgi:hypothetical protein
MSLAQSNPPNLRYEPRRRLNNSASKPKARSNEQKVTRLSDRMKERPKWLKSLDLVQKTTAILGLLLLGTTGVLYVSAYNTPQKWSQQYKKLESLQRDERELTVINETYKHQLSQEAQKKSSGLLAPTPERVIFLSPTKVKNEQKNRQSQVKSNSTNSSIDVPFSY